MNRIAELRKKLGLTQTRLGEEIGVSQQTLVNMKMGMRIFQEICYLHYLNFLGFQLTIY